MLNSFLSDTGFAGGIELLLIGLGLGLLAAVVFFDPGARGKLTKFNLILSLALVWLAATIGWGVGYRERASMASGVSADMVDEFLSRTMGHLNQLWIPPMLFTVLVFSLLLLGRRKGRAGVFAARSLALSIAVAYCASAIGTSRSFVSKQLTNGILEEASPQLRVCFDDLRKSDPAAHGTVWLDFDVAEVDRASDVRVVEAEIRNPDFHRCLVSIVQQLDFSIVRAVASGNVSVHYPMRFKAN